jgi:Zn-dependent protease with chaperone function
MDFSKFFNSYPGLYVTQAFFHSLVASAVVEIALKSWDIRSPSARQRFNLVAIASPILLFPVYQLANSARGSLSFRLEALFDSSRWLGITLPGQVTLGAGLLVVFLFTSLVFLVQELIPIVRHAIFSRKPAEGGSATSGGDMTLRMALDQLPGAKPETHVLDDEDLVIFSTTGKRGRIYVSSGLLEVLSVEQLQAALAHEIAHVVRSRRPFLITAFLLRSLMFFNPIVLLGFRRAVQEDEKICDEMAVALTKKPLVLADTLRKLYIDDEGGPPEAGREERVMDRLERYSHRLNIESRISRLERAQPPPSEWEWYGFALTLIVIVVLNYYVV